MIAMMSRGDAPSALSALATASSVAPSGSVDELRGAFAHVDLLIRHDHGLAAGERRRLTDLVTAS